MKNNARDRLSALALGTVVCCILPACDNSLSPIAEFDGRLAYTEPGKIHVLDLSTQQDNLIYTARAGTDIRNLTWDPNGTSLAFHTYSFGQHTKFIQEWKMNRVSAEGTDLTLMFDRGGPEFYPAYGPDGRLAYWGEYGIYVDGWATYLTEGIVDLSAPSWSPDARYILFASGSDMVRLALEDTSDTYNVLENSEHDSRISQPSYSPDGTRVAFVRELTQSQSEIWIVNIDGTDERALTANHFDRNPVWFRDGATIAFVRDKNSVYTIDAAPGGGIKILLSHPVEHIAWTW